MGLKTTKNPIARINAINTMKIKISILNEFNFEISTYITDLDSYELIKKNNISIQDKIDEMIHKINFNQVSENNQTEIMLDFGQAINLLKDGKKVAREGWNGKSMFLYYVPANKYPASTKIGESIADTDGKVEYGAYIAMKTAQGNVVPWLASQTDVLAIDWTEVQ